MAKSNLHGFDFEDVSGAKLKLGKTRFREFENARARILRGENLDAGDAQNLANLPLRTANNRKWTEETRYWNS